MLPQRELLLRTKRISAATSHAFFLLALGGARRPRGLAALTTASKRCPRLHLTRWMFQQLLVACSCRKLR